MNFSQTLFHFCSLSRHRYRFIGYNPPRRMVFLQVSTWNGNGNAIHRTGSPNQIHGERITPERNCPRRIKEDEMQWRINPGFPCSDRDPGAASCPFIRCDRHTCTSSGDLSLNSSPRLAFFIDRGKYDERSSLPLWILRWKNNILIWDSVSSKKSDSDDSLSFLGNF